MALVFAASAYAQTLPPTNNLVMWLKVDTLNLANGANVDFWGDSSGSGHDAVFLNGWNHPTFATNGVNGHPGVFFGAVTALHITNNLTVIAGNPPGVPLQTGLTFVGAFKTFSTDTVTPNFGKAANVLLEDSNGNSDTIAFGVSGGRGDFQRYQGGWQTLPSSYAVNNTNTYQGHFLVATHNAGTGLAQLSADGRLQGSSTIGYNGITAFNIVGNLSGSNPFNGWVSEIMVYNTSLSAGDQQQLTTYLTERWLDIPEPSAVLLLLIGAALLRRKH